MPHSQRLNHVLLFNIIIFLFLIAIVLMRFTIFKPTSKYKGNETILIGKIINIKEYDEYTKLVVKGREKIEVTITSKINYVLGDCIKIYGELKRPEITPVFNVFQYSNYLKSQNIYWQFKADKLVLIKKNKNIFYTTKERLIKYLDTKPQSSYLKTFVIGDASELETDTKQSINVLGISHLFALSGMQVSIISLVIFKLLRTIFNEKITTFFWIIILIYYLFLTSFLPSITRAIVSSIGIKCFKIKPLKIIAYLFLVLLIINPYYIYNLGFIFSFVISFFLILFRNEINNRKNYFSKLLYTSFISFLVSIPILGYNFFEINIFTPLVNMIFIPFVTFILFPITIITFLIPPLSFLLEMSINIFELLIDILSVFVFNINLPKLSLLYYLIYFILILLILKNKKYYIGLLLFFIFHAYIYSYFCESTLTMIDVKQGDSTLIRLEHNKGNILIDTGGIINSQNLFLAKSRIIPYMKSIGIKKLDYLILTHGDSDHIKEALYLVENFKIKKVLLNSGSNNTLEKAIIKKLENNHIDYRLISNYQFELGDNNFYVFNKQNIRNENNDSLIVYTKIREKNILLMGDASKEEEQYLLRKYEIPKLDILKVGHHGSKTSSGENFISNIKPRLALISVGKNNLYHHPNREVIDILNYNNTKIYQTKDSGSTIINLKTMKVNKYVS